MLAGLTAYTEYTVRVSGRNIFTPAAEAGNLFGGTSTFRTLPGGTHAVVTHVQCRSVCDTSNIWVIINEWPIDSHTHGALVYTVSGLIMLMFRFYRTNRTTVFSKTVQKHTLLFLSSTG